MPKLNGTSPYLTKDQRKSDMATKFIGRGSPRSSTNQYRKDWGALANCGTYINKDVVFVSVEGNRSGRLDPDYNELDLAISAGAKFITDMHTDRARSYNVGERQVASYLKDNNYRELVSGFWEPIE